MNIEKSKRLDALMQEQVESGAIFGGSLCVIKDGKQIYRTNVGYADKERGIKAQDDTIYRLYSMTKPITSVAVMILYERGKLDLFDNVSWYLEGFKNQKVQTADGLVDVKREVRIKDLLDMTSGMLYPDMGHEAGRKMDALFSKVYEGVFAGKPTATVDFLNMIGQQPLYFQPGEGWCYGTSADALGAVIEVISGKKFSDFLREEIFEPLGMTDTGFYVPEEKLGRFSEIYLRNDKTGILEPVEWQHLGLTYRFKKAPEFESGGAGLVSTTDDYAKFAQMLLNGGELNGVRILNKRTIEYMTTNHLTEQQKAHGFDWDSCYGYGYGNLMRILSDKGVAGTNGGLGEYGWDGWTGNYFCNDPENNLTFLYMIQVCGGNGLRPIHTLKQVLYSALDD